MSAPNNIELFLSQGYAQAKAGDTGLRRESADVSSEDASVRPIRAHSTVIPAKTPRGGDDDDDEAPEIEEMIEDLFQSIDKACSSADAQPPSKPALVKQEMLDILFEAHAKINAAVEALREVEHRLVAVPLRNFEHCLLLSTRSPVWQLLASDLCDASQLIYEWAGANNDRMDTEIMAAAATATAESAVKPDTRSVRRL